jgi:hypothetical protein
MAVQIQSAFALCTDDAPEPDDTRVTFRRDGEGAMEMRRERVPTWLLPPLTED